MISNSTSFVIFLPLLSNRQDTFILKRIKQLHNEEEWVYMGLAIKYVESSVNGVEKNTVELHLQGLADQVRRMDQKLTTRLDRTISEDFETQQLRISHTRSTIRGAFSLK
jgi:hypothetical protein